MMNNKPGRDICMKTLLLVNPQTMAKKPTL